MVAVATGLFPAFGTGKPKKWSGSNTDPSAVPTNESTTKPYIVLSGPEDVTFNLTGHDGLYQQSVTLTARMWPPIEAGVPQLYWGLPALVWCLLVGCLLVLVIILIALSLCCWLLPQRRLKILSPSRHNHHHHHHNHKHHDASSKGVNEPSNKIMAHHGTVVSLPWEEATYVVMPSSAMALIPPQYNAPPPPQSHHHQQNNHHHSHHHSSYTNVAYTSNNSNFGTGSTNSSAQNILAAIVDGGGGGGGGDDVGGSAGIHHKSMWAVNPLYASNSVLTDTDSAYRTRSLPAWGKGGSKQRPVSTTDDLEELYAKVNFSKKRKNRMRNDEAAIIALCRSRSQNMQGMPTLEREGIVVYDERTAL